MGIDPERGVQAIEGHIGAPELDRLRLEVDRAAHGGAEHGSVHIGILKPEFAAADGEGCAQLIEDEALPGDDLLLAFA